MLMNPFVMKGSRSFSDYWNWDNPIRVKLPQEQLYIYFIKQRRQEVETLNRGQYLL